MRGVDHGDSGYPVEGVACAACRREGVSILGSGFPYPFLAGWKALERSPDDPDKPSSGWLLLEGGGIVGETVISDRSRV